MDVCVTLNSNTDGLGWGLSQRPVSLTFLMVMLPYVHRRKLMTGIIKMPVIEVFRVYLTVFPGQVLSRNARPAEKSLSKYIIILHRCLWKWQTRLIIYRICYFCYLHTFSRWGIMFARWNPSIAAQLSWFRAITICYQWITNWNSIFTIASLYYWEINYFER